MSVQSIKAHNSKILISSGESSNSFENFCKAQFNNLFIINSLEEEPIHILNGSLLKHAERLSLINLMQEITRLKFLKNASLDTGYFISAYNQGNDLNRKIEEFNKLIDAKRQKLLDFKNSCNDHLTEEQKAVIDEERRRLQGLKLSLTINYKPIRKKTITWQERETAKIYEEQLKEIQRRKNHFPTTLPAILIYVEQWLLTH